MKIKIQKIYDDVIIPSYATPGSAGMDICAYTSEDIVIKKGERAVVPTGFKLSMPSADAVCLIYARSGLATKHGICLANGVGVVDSDYRGEIKVSTVNLSEQDYIIKNGDKIAQMVFSPVIKAELEEADSLDDTVRADGGFGSTGR